MKFRFIFALLGCYVALVCICSPTFRDSFKDEIDSMSRNVGKLPTDAA